MKTELERIFVSVDSGALNRLLAQPLPVQISYRLGKIAKTVDAELKEYNTARIKLLEKYGKLNGDQYEFGSDNSKKAFQSELAELLQSEVEIPGDRFKLDGLGKCEISAVDLAILMWLFEDGENDR